MRILVICQHYFPETFSITSICEELVKRGHQVAVITGLPCYGANELYPGFEKPSTSVVNGVTIYRLKVKPRKKSLFSLIQNYVSFWFNSRAFIRKFSGVFDVVYSMCLSPITAVDCGNIYAKKHHITHIHHCLDVWPESVLEATKLKKISLIYRILFFISKRIYSKMDLILVSSPSFIFYFSDVLKLKNKVKYIPQPIIQFSPSYGNVNFPKKPVFVYAGNIGSLQIIDDVVLGAAKALKFRDFYFYIVGTGSKADSVKKTISRHGVGNRIILVGKVSPELAAEYMSQSSFLVLSLLNDGSFVSKTIPNKLVTYLSFSKPILAAIGGDGGALLHETGGAVISGGSVDEICKAFLTILSFSEEKLNNMGKQNYKMFIDRFSFAKVLDQIEVELLSFKK